MGGRGAGRGRGSTGRGVGKLRPLPLAGQTPIYDGNKTNTKLTVDTWEDKNRGLNHEQLLMVGEDGFAAAYFDGGKTSVAFQVPADKDPSTLTLTHIHPAFYDRTIGGPFSDADMINHIIFGFKETRAVSVEGVYSFKGTRQSDANGFKKALQKRDAEIDKNLDKAVKSLRDKGQTVDGKTYTDLFLRTHIVWLNNNCRKYGYDFEFIPTDEYTKYGTRK